MRPRRLRPVFRQLLTLHCQEHKPISPLRNPIVLGVDLRKVDFEAVRLKTVTECPKPIVICHARDVLKQHSPGASLTNQPKKLEDQVVPWIIYCYGLSAGTESGVALARRAACEQCQLSRPNCRHTVQILASHVTNIIHNDGGIGVVLLVSSSGNRIDLDSYSNIKSGRTETGTQASDAREQVNSRWRTFERHEMIDRVPSTAI